MKVEIWSDIICPFCYIGKRHFEAALAQFPDAAGVEVIWKSFQLDPQLRVTRRQHIYEYLAGHKGISYEQSARMHEHVRQMAAAAGLEYRFDDLVVANSYDAHRLIQLAKVHALGDAMEEQLFRAYFTDGRDIADRAVLSELGVAAGLPAAVVQSALEGDVCAQAVAQDIREAQQIGVQGVPFFVFNRTYAVSGAQPVAVFLKTLQQSFAEWQQRQPAAIRTSGEGPSCSPDGTCI